MSSPNTPAAVIPDIFLGRQPILDRNQKLTAFELLFRSGKAPVAGVIDDVYATASVIANLLGALEFKQVLGGQLAFINFNADLLLSDVVELLPADQVVLEILETVQIDQTLIERLQQLKKKGFRLALDDITGPSAQLEPARPLIDIVKLDLKGIPRERLASIVKHFKSWPVQLLAEKVENREEAQYCADLGVDLFQGYYFAKPDTVLGKRVDPSRAALLKLLSQIMGDADIQKIEAELRLHPNLTFNLLRVVNAASFGARHKISSVKQCVIALGRQYLQRWVQLLLYAAGPGQEVSNNPLLHTAAVRARLMESLAAAQAPADREYQDRAFMVGILSLLDVLLSMSMQDIVKELSLADEVRDALLTRGGRIGQLLTLAHKIEADDAAGATQMVNGLDGLSLSGLLSAELNAVAWADSVGR